MDSEFRVWANRIQPSPGRKRKAEVTGLAVVAEVTELAVVAGLAEVAEVAKVAEVAYFLEE